MREINFRHSVKGTLVLAVLSILIVLCAFVVSDGLYNLDEFVIASSVEALHSKGSLVIENGYGKFASESLKLMLLVDGPHGLVPQYPVGTTALGASLMGLLGIRGLIVLNALAAAASLFATRALARQLFNDEKVALFAALLLCLGTFWLEFAYGIWPHAMSALFVTCALLCALKAIDADGHRTTKWALLSGLAIGAGMLLRLDTILILPPIGACILLFGCKPLRSIIAGTAGVIPGIVAMSITNHYKFGSYNPFSYGRHGGLTDLSTHVIVIGVAAAAVLVLVFARRNPWPRVPRASASIALIGTIGLVCAIPVLRNHAWQYLSGCWALLVDAGTIQDPRPGIAANSDGVLFFWGFVKKALGQSMPWIGVLLVWAMKPKAGGRNRALAVLLLTFGLWSFPFILTAWHGGLGSNMRYFSPLLPLLSAMGAAAWFKLLSITGNTSRSALPGVAAGLLAIAVWTWYGPSGLGGSQQIMSTYLFLMTCLACGLVCLTEKHRKNAAHAAQFLVAAGFSVSVVFGLLDLSASQSRRNLMARSSDALSAIPTHSLVYGSPEMLASRIGNPDGWIALPSSHINSAIDYALPRAAIDAGYRVYAPQRFAAAIAQTNPEFGIGPQIYEYPGGRMLEISLRPDDSEAVERSSGTLETPTPN